jgi:hypothetical protein
MDELYSSPNGSALSKFLLQNIREVQGPFEENKFDVVSGIIRGVYREGKLGDYSIPTDPTVARWESWLSEQGFDRYRGDAVAVVARIPQS